MTKSRWPIAAAAVVTAVLLLSMLVGRSAQPHASARSATAHVNRHVAHPRKPTAAGRLMAGSDPRALPGPILIADKGNNRLIEVSQTGQVLWAWPARHDLRHGQTFNVPDDAFFAPSGKQILATQEDDFVISEIDVAKHRMIWRYGVPGIAGSTPGYLWNPDDAMMLRSGMVVAADIKNCRLLWIDPHNGQIASQQGQPGQCYHAPPYAYGSPNGVFPLRDHNFLVTEIHRDRVTEVSAGGAVAWSAHPPGVSYPSDSNQAGPDRYITVDYSSPGQVVMFNSFGGLLWRYAPSGGAGALNHPSIAEVLPNGDVLVTDDGNDRVVVIDPHANRIVWQYGVRGVPGSALGYLSRPDGVDLLPPYSYANRYQS